MTGSQAPRCPETGKPMTRGIRWISLSYQGESESIPMPGWYAEGCFDGVHTPEDMAVSDRTLAELKTRAAARRSNGKLAEPTGD